MSHNSKSARKIRTAKEWSGQKGPALTTPKHGKKKAWHQIGSKRVVKKGEGGESIAFAAGAKK